MQNLNHHQVWGKMKRFNQKAAIVFVIAICLGMFSMLSASLAREFTVFYNQNCRIVTSYNHNPHSIMEKAGVHLNGVFEYEMEETENGPVLRVGPECNLQVKVDGAAYTVVSRTDRVENILASLNITLGEYDEVTPSLDTIFTEDCTIVVHRVAYQTNARTEKVAPPVVYEDTNKLPKGTVEVKVAGAYGEQLVTYSDKLVDGKLAESRAISSLVVKDAQTKVMLRGTADPKKFAPVVTNNDAVNEKILSPLEPKKPIAVNAKGQPVSYKKCIKGLATAYTANEGGNLTATGEKVQVGYVAVDPKEIPYGTMLFIKTTDGRYMYGLAKAADTGGFISGPVTVDLYFEKTEECIQFGVRDVEIYVL